MPVRVITPALPIVTVAEAKHHLRIDAEVDDDDSYIEGLIAAAQAWLDGPAGWLGRSLGPQLIELTVGAPCAPVVSMPYPPVIEIVGAWAGDDLVPFDHYRSGDSAFSFELGLDRGLPARIQYWAGYGRRSEDDPESWVVDAPAPIRHAMLLLVGQWYMVRAAVNVGNIVNEMPFAVEALVQPYRVFR